MVIDQVLFDTNIIIDYLNSIPEGREEFERYDRPSISIVTWMEVLVGAPPDLAAATRAFLDTLNIVHLDAAVADRAVSLRQHYKIRLPDAIIWASADIHSMLLVTRNTKDFPVGLPGIRIPYVLRH
ncbi:type II toxin-antitoxin system VapC family toxin [Neorhizobium alkalisoli]|uniref:type II toxin-antitoxin system VapC family toxin n=1 Tax=Neorhizobium alkalisoli TaxID=528178 RepID=UPI001FED7EFA|nr:type II toxin-antitoxin system VapC family toxin [Neorhizobium alkalisoli]